MNWVQLEFDFDELLKADDSEMQKPAIPHFAKPKNDNERFLNLQYDFLNGNRKALAKMYTLGCKVALKFIRTIAKSNRHVAELSEEIKREKAHNAITYIISMYLKNKEYVMQKSFTGYLYLRVKHELFYQRKVDRIVDFVDLDNLRGAKNENQ